MLYGSVTLTSAGRFWVVRCEPHVRSRLKRAFPRAPQEASDHIVISNTPENSRDLQWFLQRFPMEVNRPEALAKCADEHRDQEQRIADLIARRVPIMDFHLTGTPREYQAEVPMWLQAKGGLLLADDVGVGKTVSAICCTQLPDALPAVIVTPPHLMRNHWRKFLQAWLPGLNTLLVLDGDPQRVLAKRSRRGVALADRLPDIFVISYFRLRSWADTLAELAKLVVFEECQQLRHSGSNVYRACDHLAGRARYRLGLSATPIYNYGAEFFNVVDVLLPGALGTHDEFIREWCKAGFAGEKARLSDPEQFGAYLRREGIMLRRTRRDVKRELPPVSKIIHEIDADAEVIKNLTGNAMELAKTILRAGERYRGEKMQAAGEFDMLMRQATGISKAPYVAEFVRLLLENGERIVLYGWHRAVYDIWLERLKDFSPALYTGTESPKQKADAEEAFKEGKTNLLIMSLRSGAGVDGLQFKCRTVVFGEFDWSPGVHEQCVGRVDRDGQTDPVDAYFLASSEGSDPIMLEVLGVKREQSEGVRNPGGGLIERVDTGENNLRQLARAFLKGRGVDVSETPVARLSDSEVPA